MIKYTSTFAVLALVIASCSQKPKTTEVATNGTISDDSLLTLVQYQTFQYFWDNAEPVSGMGRERTHLDGVYPENDRNVITTGGSGFGLMAILVGIERGFITRQEGLNRFQQIANYLDTADRFHGAWPHWLQGETGKVKPFSKKDDGGDLVETAFLVQGMLAVREYFKDGNEEEKAVAAKMDELWRGVEWNWYTKGENVLYWHWSPNYAWEMNFPVGGYNECLIMYVLAAASPTYPIEPEAYHEGWARNGAIAEDTTFMGYETVLDHYETNDDPVGPLFWAHYSHLGLDPRKLKDKYADYWKLNQNHALIHYEYCVENPKNYEGYGENCWGLTSSYSPEGYAGHQPSHDLGVISPTAALSSFPYTPEHSMEFLRFLYNDADTLVGKYGPYDAFSFEKNWYKPHYLAIDQGPIPVMIENYRTGLLWELFMSAPEVKQGLTKLGFTNDWIAQDRNEFQKKKFVHRGDTLPYRMLLPENFNTAKKYPVVLFLHGAGERGGDNEKQLVHGSNLFIQNRQKHPAIVIFPQCPADDFWANIKSRNNNGQREFYFDDNDEHGPALTLVSDLLDSLVMEPFIDTDRVYIGGLSMGGMGTFELVSRRPDTFAAAFSICGAGNPKSAAKYAEKVPFWVFHGAKDDVVPVQHSESMVQAIKNAGGEVKFTLYPNADHNSWDSTFAEPELLNWLFSNKKNKK